MMTKSLEILRCGLAAIALVSMASAADQYQTLLQDSCAGCHGETNPEAGFSISELRTNRVAGPDLE